MNSANEHVPASDPSRRGLTFGLAAYALWGVLPIYFKALSAIGAVDIVAHRVLWSLPFLAVLVLIGGQRRAVAAAIRNPKAMRILALTATLIGVNWLLYVYAVTSGHILAASLGYYLNPIANVLLGRFFLKERLTRLQWAAVGLATAGVVALAVGALGQLWISLVLCGSFALYGLFRKIAPVVLTWPCGRDRAAVSAGDPVARLGSRAGACRSWNDGRRDDASAGGGRGFDDAASAVHGGGAAAALFDSWNAAVRCPDPAVDLPSGFTASHSRRLMRSRSGRSGLRSACMSSRCCGRPASL